MSYTIDERKQILKGQCLNNASVLIAGWTQGTINVETVLDYAQKLFDEAMERNWLGLQPEPTPQPTPTQAPTAPPQPQIMM